MANVQKEKLTSYLVKLLELPANASDAEVKNACKQLTSYLENTQLPVQTREMLGAYVHGVIDGLPIGRVNTLTTSQIRLAQKCMTNFVTRPKQLQK